jgi:hypothetical protein
VPGEKGARLKPEVEARQRALSEVYRVMSEASRKAPREPGFWSSFRTNLRSNLLGR